MNINPVQIAQAINDIYDGVESSKAGEIRIKDSEGNIVINNIGYQTYLSILNSLMPKNISGDMKVKESL